MFNSLLFSSSKIIWAFILLGFDIIRTPRMSTIAVIFTLVVIDFITGIAKAKIQKIARTSEGYRKTIIKIMQYLIVPVVFWIASYYIKSHIPPDKETAESIQKLSVLLEKIGGWLMLFIVYIEITSIFENIYEIDKKGMFSMLLKPLLIILKFGIENNPISKLANKLTVETKDTKVIVETPKTTPTNITVESKPIETK